MVNGVVGIYVKRGDAGRILLAYQSCVGHPFGEPDISGRMVRGVSAPRDADYWNFLALMGFTAGKAAGRGWKERS